MKAELNIRVERFEARSKSIPSHVTFTVANAESMETLAELHFEGLENADYLVREGFYTASVLQSPKFKREAIYIDVPNRIGIMIHVGNTKDDTRGCLLIGLERLSKSMIGSSAKAINLVNALLDAYDIEKIVVFYKSDYELPF